MRSALRSAVSMFLNNRAVLRNALRPTKKNTVVSLLLIAVATPLTLIVSIALVSRRVMRRPLRLIVLPIGSEFSFLVRFLEHLRGSPPKDREFDAVLALSKWRHRTLTALYKREFRCQIIWTDGLWGLVQQALLTQPNFLVERKRLPFQDVWKNFNLPLVPLREPPHLIETKFNVLQELNMTDKEYVAVSVHTRTYDEQRNPHYASKGKKKESSGSGLANAVDLLTSRHLGVIRLGSPDVGEAHIPRDIPRLEDFGALGGAHEVALASGCKYFWSDGAGAMWLSYPFHRPVMFTNQYSIALRVDVMKMWNERDIPHLVLPIRFETSLGSRLTFRDELQSPPLFKKLEELVWIRNSSEELVDAHKEMLARLDGSWVETTSMREIRSRFENIYVGYPHVIRPFVATTFLMKHTYLLE